MYDYRQINYDVMTDTVHQYQNAPELHDAIRLSVARQYMIAHEDVIPLSLTSPQLTGHTPNIVISGKRTFEAAKGYKGKKVAVLNFANNHSVGGAPFAAGAQEESLCRCSTLYPCLRAMNEDFYKKHVSQYEQGIINYMGNDDLIYTPDVIVFKSDERTDPVYPKMMPRSEWYRVDVITSAAPELWRGNPMPHNYEAQIASRIKKILDVAALERVEVLILGAWGCGAFRNPVDVVARIFRTMLENYNFETVEFALCAHDDLSNSPFASALQNVDLTAKPQMYNRKFTGKVTRLQPNQVFVFGSNIRGYHGGGAAGFAHAKFGAEWGVGEGMTGQCYALPTMEGGVDYIQGKVNSFIDFAEAHPDLEFLVTPVACGIAGFKVSEIAPLFQRALPLQNVILPESFVRLLESK